MEIDFEQVRVSARLRVSHGHDAQGSYSQLLDVVSGMSARYYRGASGMQVYEHGARGLYEVDNIGFVAEVEHIRRAVFGTDLKLKRLFAEWLVKHGYAGEED